MSRHVALLRAVNVGGRATITMADLRATAEAIGFESVTSVLQSGSMVFAGAGKGPELEASFEAALKAQLGLATTVMVRSAAQWQAAIAANPFADMAKSDPGYLLLLAAKTRIKADAEAALRTAIKGKEMIAVAGDLAYAVYPDGIGRSKMTTAVLEHHLGTPVTGRNWNTVLKIADLLGG